MDGKRVLEIYNKMNSDRGNMESLWAEVIRYCFPYERPEYNSSGGNESTPGKRRASPVCSYPVLYANRLGSSLHNSAFPSNDFWFEFTFEGVDMENNSELREWCRKARDKTHLKMRQGTNFYQESHAMMLGLATLGTSGFYTYYKNGGLHFRYVPIHKNLYIARNCDGDIDMVAVLHEWTAKEAIEEYGIENVSKSVRDALFGGYNNQKFSYIQLIYPKLPYGEKYDLAKGEKPYGDVTVEKDTQNVVAVAGHIQFPFAVPRFLLSSDDLYGRSPAMNAMCDIKAANALRKTMLEAALRAIKPPVFINSLIGKPISIEAGALNRIPNFDPNSIWAYPSPSNFPVGKDLMFELQESLKQAFYIDVFQAIDQQRDMTATEITERVRQKVEAVAPIVSRLQREFSGKVIMQCLNLLMENGEIDPPPQSADGSYFSVAYISSIDAMLQQGIASKTMNFMNQAGLMAQVLASNPDYTNLFNTDKIARKLADCNMLPANYFRSVKETEALRAAQAQAQQEAMQSQQEAQQSQAALNYSQADREASQAQKIAQQI